jgi:hypothetical protein
MQERENEVEVTPEMINAGRLVLTRFECWHLPEWVDRAEFLEAVYVAMHGCTLSAKLLAMAKPSKKAKRKGHSTEPVDMPQMPFEEAVKRMLSSPPQHKTAGKSKKKA